MTSAVKFEIQELLSDERSNQVQYQFSIINNSNEIIEVLSIEPNEIEGGSSVKVVDATYSDYIKNRSKLIDDLDSLLNSYLWCFYESYRDNWINQAITAAKKIFTATLLIRIYTLPINLVNQSRWVVEKEISKAKIKIWSLDDAQSAFDRFFSNESIFDSFAPRDQAVVVRELFKEKLDQLHRLESSQDSEKKTYIEPGDAISVTYMTNFQRGLMNSKKYQVSVEASFKEQDDASVKTRSVSHSIRISPNSLVLNIVAIIGSILGVFIYREFGQSGGGSFIHIFAPYLSGGVLALVVFNAYEFTSWGEALKMPLAWRSAMVIGAVAGLAQTRVVGALGVLVGLDLSAN